MSHSETTSTLGSAAENADVLHRRSSDGKRKPLRSALYEQLAGTSDSYHPTKKFTGYVDPRCGVILVDWDTYNFANKMTRMKLAYEKKNHGRPVPTDESRPISGFTIMQGNLDFQSGTISGDKEDELHEGFYVMTNYEKTKIAELVADLKENDEYPDTLWWIILCCVVLVGSIVYKQWT